MLKLLHDDIYMVEIFRVLDACTDDLGNFVGGDEGAMRKIGRNG